MEIVDQFRNGEKFPNAYRPLLERLPALGFHLTALPFMMVDTLGRRKAGPAPKTAFVVALFTEDTVDLPAFIGTPGPTGILSAGYHQMNGLAAMDIFTPAPMMNIRKPSSMKIGFDIDTIITVTNAQYGAATSNLSAQAVLRASVAEKTTLSEWVDSQETLLSTYLPDGTAVQQARFLKLRTLAEAAVPAKPQVPVVVPNLNPDRWVSKRPVLPRFTKEPQDWHSLAEWVKVEGFDFTETYFLWSLGVEVPERGELQGLPKSFFLDMLTAQYQVDVTSLHKPVPAEIRR